MTGVGMILGTAAYMSPEQAKGRAADKRSDIWAFGAVLYEMLTGRRAFEGEDLSDTFANVLKGDPDWSRMPEDTPSQIRTLLRRSLEKDRKRRLSDIADARLEIEDASGMPTLKAHLSAPARFHMPFWWKVLPLGTMMVGLAAGYSAWMLRPISPPSVTRFVDVAAEGIVLPNPNFSSIALAPDGESAAFLADTRVFLRKFDRLVPEPVFDAGDGVVSRGLFFSPDGQWIGFWLRGYLTKVSVSGGAPVVVCALPTTPLGATWGADNNILLGGSDGIWRVSGDGGTPQRVITLGAGQRAYGPQLLPDGRTVLFTLAQTTDWNDAQIVVQSLEGGMPRAVLRGGTDGRYIRDRPPRIRTRRQIARCAFRHLIPPCHRRLQAGFGRYRLAGHRHRCRAVRGLVLGDARVHATANHFRRRAPHLGVGRSARSRRSHHGAGKAIRLRAAGARRQQHRA